MDGSGETVHDHKGITDRQMVRIIYLKSPSVERGGTYYYVI